MTELTASESAFLSKAEAFLQFKVKPKLEQFYSKQKTCSDLLSDAAKVGLLRLEVPVELGGLGASFICKVELAKMLASADFGVAMSLINTHNVVAQISNLEKGPSRSSYLGQLMSGRFSACTAITEPGAGSDVAAIQTFAVAHEGGWLLSGTKSWIVNARDARFMVVYAQTKLGAGVKGIAAFLIDAEDANFVRLTPEGQGPIPTMGVGSFALSNYQCSSDQMILEPGLAFKEMMISINAARIYVAAMCCGMVEDCIEVVRNYGNDRHAFGMPLNQHQGWRWTIANARVELAAATALVAQAAKLIDCGVDAQILAAKAKIFATQMASRQVAELMHKMGAEGLSTDQPFARHLLAAQAASLVDGSTEILLERISRGV